MVAMCNYILIIYFIFGRSKTYEPYTHLEDAKKKAKSTTKDTRVKLAKIIMVDEEKFMYYSNGKKITGKEAKEVMTRKAGMYEEF